MRLKTSCFNATVYRKNLTRFAPVWGVYALGLVVSTLLLYSNGGTAKQFHFASHMTGLVEIMGYVNLLYAPLIAQLLFGDLYNSRMCNMLHAFPLRRENWFITNVLSGLTFSLVPTAAMALVSLPLLAGSIFEGATSLAFWIFLASNLEFMCFFGMAVFAAMCVGNRFTMAAGYGLLNAGAAIAYWLIDTVYTPMLYGIITPTQLMSRLTPMAHIIEYAYIKTSANLYDLQEIFGNDLKGAAATFTITDEWWHLWMLAGVGIGFALLGLLLYRHRDLECAGDAVAFPVLMPVFQVLCAIFVAAAAQMFLYTFTGMSEQSFLVLTVGLVVGWYIGKMLLERSSRVFTLKNTYGLAALAAVFAVSLWMTHVDLFRIETRLPKAESIKSVTFGGRQFEEQEDIENFLALNRDALENRNENWGTFVWVDGEWIQYIDTNSDRIDEENENNRYTYVDSVNLTYTLDSGKQIRRRYYIWMDNEYVSSEAGRIANDYLTQWDTINSRTITVNGVEYNRLDYVLQNVKSLYVDYMEEGDLQTKLATEENVRSLVAALQADCAEGHMTQNDYYHTGYFRMMDEHAEKGYYDTASLGISIGGKEYTWWISIYGDSRHTIDWLRSHDLLAPEVRSGNIRY